MPWTPCACRPNYAVSVIAIINLGCSLFIPALVQHTRDTLNPLVDLASFGPVFPRLRCACYSILLEFELRWLASIDGLDTVSDMGQ